MREVQSAVREVQSAIYTLVGSGTLLPSATRGSAAHHLRTSTASVLLDCGSGTLHGLARAGIDWMGIDVIALSHYHTDHVGDLPALLAAFRIRGRTRPLTIAGPSDLADVLAHFAGLFGRWVNEPEYPLSVRPCTGEVIDLSEDVRLTTTRTPHTETSIALRLDGTWGAFGYTGDTGPSESVDSLFRGVDLLVAECGSDDDEAAENHLSPATLVRLVQATRPAETVVTHVYPPNDPVDVAARVAAGSGMKVRPGYDGLVVHVGSGATP